MQITQFKGIKTDTSDKSTPAEYFRRLENFNMDSISGFDQVEMPSVEKEIGGAGYGLFQYRYLDSDNQEQTDVLSIFDGTLYKDSLGTPTVVETGLSEDDYVMQVYRDELYMACEGQNTKIYNGENSTLRDMGAPEAVVSTMNGVLTGTYRYTMTYTKGGIERVIEAYSNTINPTLKRVNLNLPIGYAGTTVRKIYRTKANEPGVYYLLTTIGDNTTLTYEDNLVDGSLGAEISGTVLAQPQCKYIISSYEKLIVTGDPKYPTQVFVSEANLRLFDTTIYLDISNQGNDNTPVRGLAKGYDKVYTWSDTQHYVADVSGTTNTVRSLQSNVGVLSGYSPANVPKDAGIEAGVIFYASDGTIRNAVGNFQSGEDNSLDNISSGNKGQDYSNNLKSLGMARAKGIYYNNKYHLTFPEKNVVVTYDIRTNSFHEIKGVNVSAWAIIDKELYSQTDDGNIEKWYQSQTYRGEYLGGYVESPSIAVSEDQKKINKIYFWLNEEKRVKAKVTIIIEDDYSNPIIGNLEINGGDFAKSDFFIKDFLTNVRDDDYRVIHINRYGRWIKWILEPEEGRVQIRAITFDIENPEEEEE